MPDKKTDNAKNQKEPNKANETTLAEEGKTDDLTAPKSETGPQAPTKTQEEKVKESDCSNATGHTWVAYEQVKDGFKQRCRDCGNERVGKNA